MNAAQAPRAIEVRGLHKSFLGNRGAYAVLEGVSFALRQGELVSVVGPSGGGKSTLLNILAGLERPDAGQVLVAGYPPVSGRDCAYMQQKDLLLPWRSLWDNLLLAPELNSAAARREAEPQARAMLREFGLEGFQHHYPAQLSGGMRQRAALIRTLLCRREIWLLDEPFGALDAITRRRLQHLLLRAWREFGITVVLVTHDVEEAVLLSQRVVVLSGRPGRVLREVPVTLAHEQREHAPESLALKASILEWLKNGEPGD